LPPPSLPDPVCRLIAPTPDSARQIYDLYAVEGRQTPIGKALYDQQQGRFTSKLRYGGRSGLKGRGGRGRRRTIKLINWDDPSPETTSPFAEGSHGLRQHTTSVPTSCSTSNGIAVAVLGTQKQPRGRLATAIRQRHRQSAGRNSSRPFFLHDPVHLPARQLTSRGGMQYGTIGTEEKYFLKVERKTEAGTIPASSSTNICSKMCNKKRLNRAECTIFVPFLYGGVKKAAACASVFRESRPPKPAVLPAHEGGINLATRRGQRQKASSWCCWANGFLEN